MIEGTRQYKGKQTAAAPSTEPDKAPQPPAPSDPAPQPNAEKLERREWFSSLIPALGDGLVKILRASNNLQQDLQETLKKKSDSLSGPEEKK
jgi:hypothetical protein